jgi:hypothetical protein
MWAVCRTQPQVKANSHSQAPSCVGQESPAGRAASSARPPCKAGQQSRGPWPVPAGQAVRPRSRRQRMPPRCPSSLRTANTRPISAGCDRQGRADALEEGPQADVADQEEPRNRQQRPQRSRPGHRLPRRGYGLRAGLTGHRSKGRRGTPQNADRPSTATRAASAQAAPGYLPLGDHQRRQGEQHGHGRDGLARRPGARRRPAPCCGRSDEDAHAQAGHGGGKEADQPPTRHVQRQCNGAAPAR